MIVRDVRADACRRPEIERRAGHRSQFARRDLRGVDRCVAVRVDLDNVVEHVTVAVAGEVEVGVLREIDRSGLVGRRRYSTTI